MKWMLVGIAVAIVIGSGNVKADFTFGEPTNLGPTVNSPDAEFGPCISADELELYFHSAPPAADTIWTSGSLSGLV